MTERERLDKAIQRGYKVDDTGIVISPYGRTLVGYIDNRGYTKIGVRYEDISSYPIYIHRLVAYLKFGERLFDPGIETRHFNGNKLDNSNNNILIGTHSDNMQDIPKEVRKRTAQTAANYLRKLTEQEVVQLRTDYKNGLRYKYLTNKYNIAKSTIWYIINKVTYGSVGESA